MSNVITANPWSLDTEGAVYTHSVKIKTIHWVTPAAADDVLIIKDKNGNVIVQAVCEVDGSSQIFRIGKWYAGLTVDTLDSGTVLVHVT
jgi:hypothetical protein